MYHLPCASRNLVLVSLKTMIFSSAMMVQPWWYILFWKHDQCDPCQMLFEIGHMVFHELKNRDFRTCWVFEGANNLNNTLGLSRTELRKDRLTEERFSRITQCRPLRWARFHAEIMGNNGNQWEVQGFRPNHAWLILERIATFWHDRPWVTCPFQKGTPRKWRPMETPLHSLWTQNH